jgi:hypothetical protein
MTTLSLLAIPLGVAAALAVRRRLVAAQALWETPGADFLAFQQHRAGDTGLAVNPEATALCLAHVGRPARLVAPERLLGAEVIEDGAVVLRRDRSGRWDGWERDLDLRARHQQVRGLALRVLVDDPAGPAHEVRFLDRAVSKESAAYREAAERAQHWFRVVSRLIERGRGLAG